MTVQSGLNRDHRDLNLFCVRIYRKRVAPLVAGGPLRAYNIRFEKKSGYIIVIRSLKSRRCQSHDRVVSENNQNISENNQNFKKYTLYDGPDALIANKLSELGEFYQ